MMTRQLIEITFGNAMTQANQLEACADDMVALANRRMEQIKNDILAAWQGESAHAYTAKMDQTGEGILATARNLYQIAETIREAARQFRDAELRALEIAQQRTY